MQNKSRRLVVYNHEYHLKSLPESDNTTYLKVNSNEPCVRVSEQIPILESVAIYKRFFERFKYQSLIDRLVFDHGEILIFGMQDYLSNYACWSAIKNDRSVGIVPDNIEFFLRPGFSRCTFSFKRVIKALSLGLSLFRLNQDYLFFCNRLLFKMRGRAHVNFELSCFNVDAVRHENSSKFRTVVFVSQPYYRDYNLNVKDWVHSVRGVLDGLSKDFGEVCIRYHQRDVLSYKEYLSHYNSEPDTTVGRPIYIGFFSTYMIELALAGAEVYSYYNQVRGYFPVEYNTFVMRVANKLNIDLTGGRPWRLALKDMEGLFKDGF